RRRQRAQRPPCLCAGWAFFCLIGTVTGMRAVITSYQTVLTPRRLWVAVAAVWLALAGTTGVFAGPLSWSLRATWGFGRGAAWFEVGTVIGASLFAAAMAGAKACRLNLRGAAGTSAGAGGIVATLAAVFFFSPLKWVAIAVVLVVWAAVAVE